MINYSMQSGVVIDVLSNIEDTLEHPIAMLKDMGEHLTGTTQQRFKTSTAPDGSKWAPNTQTTYLNILGKQHSNKNKTINTKGVSRITSKKPNVLSNNLMNSIHYQTSGDLLLVGSPLIYAGTAHFGAKKHAFGSGAPWGDIPAREYLGISMADEKELYAIAEDHLMG